jgi:hypothetical protein
MKIRPGTRGKEPLMILPGLIFLPHFRQARRALRPHSGQIDMIEGMHARKAFNLLHSQSRRFSGISVPLPSLTLHQVFAFGILLCGGTTIDAKDRTGSVASLQKPGR